MTDNRHPFRISVAELAEFCCRRGDLQLGLERSPSAQDGQRGQRLLQQNRPLHYQTEISVKTIIEAHDFQCILSGRIDGLQVDEITLLEEIKTTYCTRTTLPQPLHQVHWAQLKLYAALYLLDKPDAQLLLRLLYLNLDNESRFEFELCSTRAEIMAFYNHCIQHYQHWLQLQCHHFQQRDQYLQSLPFPFQPFRPGQRALSVQAYRDLRDQRQAIYQAATGLGKTAALLFPAQKLLAEKQIKQIFYLTAKNSGQRSVIQALSTTTETGGSPFRSLMLGARSRQCFCSADESSLCQWQLGFYDRLPAALQQFQQQSHWDPAGILQLAQQNQLCPHQFNRQLLPWVDLVIADYNYVFDPGVRLGDYLEKNARHCLLLIDEAHNLPERARAMFSVRIEKRTLEQACALTHDKPIQRKIKKLLSHFPADNSTAVADTQAPTQWLDDFAQASEGWLEWFTRQQWLVPATDLFEALMNCMRFSQRLHAWQPTDRLIRSGEKPTPWLEIFCTDPAPELRRITELFYATAFFSGSLLPLHFFARALSDTTLVSQISIPSPFPPRHQCTLIVPINTRYESREASIPVLGELITTVWNSQPGRYLVSFPSYQYLHAVLAYLQQQQPDLPLLAQTSDDQALPADQFLQALTAPYCLALVIAGGSYAEGLDLARNMLQGVIVIGTCMPPPTLQRELIRQTFEGGNRRGFDFAYTYPGINRVIQSAGRVIRSETDRGVVILADDRFARADYLALLPEHWHPRILRQPKDLTAPLLEFWSPAV